MIIAKEISLILNRLEEHGYMGYLVGGTVRDYLMGKEIGDYDITTNASPQSIMEIFSDKNVLPTGIALGTVTVIWDNIPCEITSHRADGNYTDSRRPDSVSYQVSLEQDLSRRDFTMNAIAYNPKTGYIDPFNGADDISSKIIRAVGSPNKRFREDGLRIMRGLRFASVHRFDIEEETKKAIFQNKDMLEYISGQRFMEELSKLIIGENFENVLREYVEVVAVKMPELLKMVGFNQLNPHHIYDVWEHTLKAMSYIEAKPLLRLTMLLHDIGKPATFTIDEKGIGHFYGHAPKGGTIAGQLLKKLNLPRHIISKVCMLIRFHYLPSKLTRKGLKLLIGRVGTENLAILFELRVADNAAKSDIGATETETTLIHEAMLRDIVNSGECCSIRELKISGEDIINEGIPQSPVVGKILRELLDEVLDNIIANKKEDLIIRAVELGGEYLAEK